nr:protocadherin Fat 4-like [Lytechinus pictus]
MFNVTVTTDPPTENVSIQISPDSTDKEAVNIFSIEGLQVFYDKGFDFENKSKINFLIDCNDGGGWSSGDDSLIHEVSVLDVNEHAPFFDVNIITAIITENAEHGTLLMTDVPIQAFDDDGSDVDLSYSISDDLPFRVTSGCQSGQVFLILNDEIDYETQMSYDFTLTVKDGGQCSSGFDPKEGNVTIMVLVNDTDDEPPVFSQDNYNVTIPERNSSFVYMDISATDGDTLNTPLQFSFIGQSGDWGCLDYLAIDPYTAEVTLKKELDYETSLDPCIITIQAVQQNKCEMVGQATLSVTVADVNECPSFISESYSGQLTDADPFVIVDDGSERLIISMTDEDLTFVGDYFIVSDNVVELVQVSTQEGSNYPSFYIKFLDMETITDDTELQIYLSDNTTDVECDDSVTNVTVQLTPDGLAPNFTESHYRGEVAENATDGTEIVQVEATNSDMTSEGIVYRLQMASDGGENVFGVDVDSGVVSVVDDTDLDAETVQQYTLLVEAVDQRGTYYRSSIVSVIIEVIDINEHVPRFPNDTMDVEIEEELPIGFPIRTVQANDSDVDALLEYSISETDVPFRIDKKTGEILTDGELDRDEGPSTYNITVVVSDGQNEDDYILTISLTDINDNAPEFTGGPIEVSVPENTTDPESLKVIEATDIDEGVNAEIVYSLMSPDDDNFSIDNETGMLYANGPYDYETVREYILVISASDSRYSTLTTVTVRITDVNDNAPVFTSLCSMVEVEEDADVDRVICTVVAEDLDDDGNDAITYSLDQSNGNVPFKIDDPTTGEIKIAQKLDRESESSYNITILAEDDGDPPLSNSTTVIVVVLDVNDEEPMFEDASLEVYIQKGELAFPPVLISTVKATDGDQHPWNIIQCEKTGGEDSFVVLTGQDGACEVYAYEELDILPEPYMVTFYAFNPDNRDRRSENMTLSVHIRETVCFITIVNEDEYDVIVLESELDSSVPLNLTLDVISNCNEDDVMFEILSQRYRKDKLAEDFLPAENFTIDPTTGEIFPTDNVMEGEHNLLVSAYNVSDNEVNETTTVRVVVTGENTPPEFKEEIYFASITTESESTIVVIELDVEASDDDYPSFGNGELRFEKGNETSVDSETDYFAVSPTGQVTTTSDKLNKINNRIFELVVKVIDGGKEPLSDTAVVIIDVNIQPCRQSTDDYHRLQ